MTNSAYLPAAAPILRSEPMIACPLCGGTGASESWLGRTHWEGNTYEYLKCNGCRSLFCSPMPDGQAVAKMYGPNYVRDVGNGRTEAQDDHVEQVVRFLSNRPGLLVDYGCRDGILLSAVRAAGWRTMGVELDPQVAAETEQATGIPIRTPGQPELTHAADVLHLGDVIEHLTEMDRQFPEALRILKPGGILIAQGPLQNAPNLFTLVLRVARRLRQRITNMAPTHVILATSKGQRALFARMGLKELQYTVTEEMWPAPPRLFTGLRGTSLYVLRRISQAVTAVWNRELGNRYFYAGRFGD
jgi:SAM-dependent methyltransferase